MFYLLMLRSYKYRMYPTNEQKVMLAKTFGCCRLAYNWALDLKEKAYKEEGKVISEFEMCKRVICELRDVSAPWMKEVSAKAINFAIRDLYEGYKNFFEGRANKPKYRSKRGRQHYHDRVNYHGYGIKVDFKEGLVSVPKIYNIPCVLHRRFEGNIRQVAVEMLTSGRYYISVLVEDGKPAPTPLPVDPDKTIGIDTGLLSFAVLSDGRAFEPLRTTEQEKRKLKLMQRRFRKKQKDSRQFCIYKRRIAKYYDHISNRRHDHVHKLTHQLVSDSQATTICVENLNLKGMVKNKYLAYSIQDVCIGMFYSQLEYKCKWAGKNFVKIDRFAPSSKMCSRCGHINKRLTLKIREWTCPECGTHHERDLNAAINIKHFGLSEKSPYPRYWGKVTPVEQPLVDDRSSEPKKLHRRYTARRVRADETGKLKDSDSQKEPLS